MKSRETLRLAIVLAFLALGGAASIAWNVWPPLVRYRLSRMHDQMVHVVGTYLRGTDSFDQAAQQLAILFTESRTLVARLPIPSLDEGTARIEHEGIAPAGYSEKDPRIDSLARRAYILSVPPEQRSHIKELMSGSR